MCAARIGVLVPPLGADPGLPEALPVGRAALALAAEGVTVVFADRVASGRASGVIAAPGGWREVRDVPIAAAYDRFPSERRAGAHAALLEGLGGVPIANPPRAVALCRDKIATQRVLEEDGVSIPEVEVDPERFAERLSGWGAGFLKPRFGALGRGVCRVVPGDPLPAMLPGTVPGTEEPAVLQRAVAPWGDGVGQCCRVLVQRGLSGAFVAVTPVVRTSRTDPVVNVARGAEVRALADAMPDRVEAVAALAVRAAETLAARLGGEGERVVELGVDLVVERGGRVWVIEVNGRPRGRLEVLLAQDAGRFAGDHLEACARPLRWLARRFVA